MVEGRRIPGRRGMALLAILRKTQCYVVGIRRPLKILQVAGHAGRVGDVVIVIDVALDTGHGGVSAGQWESCGAVVELGVEPGVHTVALLAGCDREYGLVGRVVRIRGLLVGVGMAGVALGGEPRELPGRGSFVASLAIYHGVRAQQGKTVLVILHRLDGNVPSFDGVTLLALGAELAAMDVSVAVRALGADVGEHQFGVALHTSHVLVQAAQGIARLIVIEFRDGADRLPGCRRMAVLAGKVQIPMRAAALNVGGRLRTRGEHYSRHQYQQGHNSR